MGQKYTYKGDFVGIVDKLCCSVGIVLLVRVLKMLRSIIQVDPQSFCASWLVAISWLYVSQRWVELNGWNNTAALS